MIAAVCGVGLWLAAVIVNRGLKGRRWQHWRCVVLAGFIHPRAAPVRLRRSPPLRSRCGRRSARGRSAAMRRSGGASPASCCSGGLALVHAARRRDAHEGARVRVLPLAVLLPAARVHEPSPGSEWASATSSSTACGPGFVAARDQPRAAASSTRSGGDAGRRSDRRRRARLAARPRAPAPRRSRVFAVRVRRRWCAPPRRVARPAVLRRPDHHRPLPHAAAPVAGLAVAAVALALPRRLGPGAATLVLGLEALLALSALGTAVVRFYG